MYYILYHIFSYITQDNGEDAGVLLSRCPSTLSALSLILFIRIAMNIFECTYCLLWYC